MLDPNQNTNLAPTLQFVNSAFSPNANSNSSPYSANYTPPNQGTPSADQIAQAVLKRQQDQQSASGSPLGMSPQSVGKMAGKVANNFSSLTGGITSAVDNFGMGLGFGSGGGAAEAISPALAAADPSLVASAGSISEGAASAGSLTGASLSGVLGAGALGVLGGGMLAGALGENPLGGSIGGGIGAAAGMAFGGAAFGALGMELGMAAGPIGALVGGIGGSLIGGLFGGHSPPTNADAYYATLGDINNGTHTSKNAGATAGFGQKAVSSFNTIAQQASTALGFTLDPKITVEGTISTKHPGPGGPANLTVNSSDGKTSTGFIFYNPDDPTSVKNAQKQALLAAASQSGYTDTEALTKWFDTYNPNQAQSGTFTAAPQTNIPMKQSTFAQYMSKQNGTNATPTT